MADNKVTKVQLTLHALKLKNVAGTFKGTSDPYAVVTLLSSDPKEKPVVLGKTEVIKNSLDPRWTTSFELDYEFGKTTRVNVGIYDEIRKAKKNKPMGSALFEVGEVLGARGSIKAKTLRNGGTLFARITRAPTQDMGTLTLQLQGIKLKNVDGMFGKSDPFFEILARVDAAGGPTWQPVVRSKPIMNNLNPVWPPFSVPIDRLCAGDLTKPVMITVYDWEKSGKHTNMGSFETNAQGLMNAQVQAPGPKAKMADTSKAFTLKRRNKEYGKVIVTQASKSGGTSSSTAAATATTARPTAPQADSTPDFSTALDGPSKPTPRPAPTAPVAPVATAAAAGASTAAVHAMPPPVVPPAGRASFIDYIQGGLELQMTVAIDFTGSNGDPRRPGTLHYTHRDGTLNDYEKAITAVGSVVARYDSDQKFPVLGFGAKFQGVINHCFQVGRTAELQGIKGILEGYRSVFKTGLTMSGPTSFAEVIGYAAQQARRKQADNQRIGQQAYNILLILTDGAVSDIQQTKRAITAASDAPLSIVIIGIGDADFGPMQFLDDFQQQEGAGRDIVQFVEFSRYRYDKSALTRETLDEIPDQLVDYFHSRGIAPLPAISGSRMSLSNIDVEPFNEDEDVDLSIDISPDGEITLDSSQAAMFDETSYGTMGQFTGAPAAVAPPAPTAPAQPYQPQPAYAPQGPYQPQVQGGYPPQGYPPQQPVQGGVYQQPVQASAYEQPRSSLYQQPGQPPMYAGGAPPVVAPRAFLVQVPPGFQPGMQIQVQNPATGQPMVVSIPPNVPPGGTFPVNY